MGQPAELVEPTLGIDPQGAQQVEGRQGYSPSLFTDVACKAMVEDNVGDDGTDGFGDEETEHFPKPRKENKRLCPPRWGTLFTTLRGDS